MSRDPHGAMEITSCFYTNCPRQLPRRLLQRRGSNPTCDSRTYV